MANLNKSDLGYLGIDFQYRFIKALMEDNGLFRDLHGIIDQNMFTDPLLKTYVGTMKNYYEKNDAFPSYEMMGIALNSQCKSDIDKEMYEALNKKIRQTQCDGVNEIKEMGIKFFRQQNIIKTANSILNIAGTGDTERYDQCVDLLQEALSKGASYNLGEHLFDELNETLADDYREPIPTGIGKLDESLNGGLGKGELGVIIGSSGFGKSQPLTSRILTPKGFKLMKDITIGDEVIGRDGMPYSVTGVFPQGKRPIYRVTFSNDTSCECDIEHLWNVRYKKSSKYETITLQEIIENGYMDDNFQIPSCHIVLFEERKMDKKPYYIGLKISESLKNGIEYSVPNNAIYNTVIRRVTLLQAIIDTLADVNALGKYKIPFKSYNKTVDNLIFIIRSLGCDLHIEYNSIIIDNISNIINLLLVDENTKYTKDDDREPIFIEKIEPIGYEEAKCIMVDSDEHLYITEDFIVTHNTTVTTAMANFAATYKCEKNLNQGYNVLQIVFEDGVKAIKRKHLAHLTQIEACNLSKPEFINEVKDKISKCEDYELLQKNLRILALPTGEITATKIKEIIKKLQNIGFNPDMVVIDYFECIDIGDVGKGENEFNREGKVMRKFESMAKELNFALWVTTQGTKDSVNAEIVTMEKAGGSFKKVQIAHIVVSIARTTEDIRNNKATLALLKNRAGGSGSVWTNVTFNNGTCTISTDEVEDYEDMFEYKKKKDKEEIDLQISIFKALKNKQKQQDDD